MIALNDVTIVCVDDIVVPFSELALRDTLEVVQPADVLFWSDSSEFEIGQRLPFHDGSIEEAGRVLWYEAPFATKTSHLLTIQWDGFPYDATAWQDEFLSYDYIGAPWHWLPDRQVGNGGFSLRSVRLMRFLAEHQADFPYRYPEDEAICRRYGAELEKLGFRFAPLEVACRFSFEGQRMTPTFGFHGVWNWQVTLTDKQCHDRFGIENNYAESKIDWTMLRMRGGRYHA